MNADGADRTGRRPGARPSILIAALDQRLVKRLRTTFGGKYAAPPHGRVRVRSRAILAEDLAIVPLVVDDAPLGSLAAAELAWWVGCWPTLGGIVLATAPSIGPRIGGDEPRRGLVGRATIIRGCARNGFESDYPAEIVPDVIATSDVPLLPIEDDVLLSTAAWIARRFGPHQFAAIVVDPAVDPDGKDHRRLRALVDAFRSQIE